jgi:hypothetical protein
MRLKLQKQGALKFVSQIIPWGEQSRAAEVMRPKLQKQSALKFAGRIILHKQGHNTPQRARDKVSKACFGVHTRYWELF